MKNSIILLVFLTGFSSSHFGQPTEKKIIKIEKRYIHPKSKYLAFSAGWGFTSILTKDPNDFLTEGLQFRHNTRLPNIMYEHGIKHNIFAETGYSRTRQGVFFSSVAGSAYSGLYFANDIHLGVGYRLIAKNNNLNFINFHSGIFLGFANIKESSLQSTFGRNETDPITNEQYSVSATITNFNSVAIGPYVGISKEFRMSKEVRFFAKYIQRFGVSSIMSGTFTLSSDEIDFVEEPATFKVTGGGAFVTFGLKIGLLNKMLK
jgi:hypothetical protein